ncbi:hypothetical protein [Silanimonas sp.]|jgi:hypothetical protein|uniref:hypothetical protein n=1 Tax=Silanimonas sp. TaxID=1929290 RepID=UPI0022C26301|nr:hypothetical protein [Silanimonas sp.]MCZ8113560.1 hypothetical protein [Silanimonas sp.]
MSIVASILIAIAVAIALVLGSRLWFDRVQKRTHAQRIGIEVLNTRRWRESLDLLVQALAKDGYTQAAEVTGPNGMPLAERHLARGGNRVLLIYKHGTSYHIGAAALLDAERRRQEAEMDEVIVATLGSLDGDALAQAARMKVACFDGPTVWSKVRDVLDSATQEAVAAEAEALVERPRRLATIGASVLGLGIVVWGGKLDPSSIASFAALEASPPIATPAPSAAASAEPSAMIPVATPAADTPAAPQTMAASSDEERRGALAKAITALPEVQRASWSSGSTMIVALRPRVGIERGVEATCALTAAYPVLRDVRLQLEASGGAEVRWHRCA